MNSYSWSNKKPILISTCISYQTPNHLIFCTILSSCANLGLPVIRVSTLLIVIVTCLFFMCLNHIKSLIYYLIWNTCHPKFSKASFLIWTIIVCSHNNLGILIFSTPSSRLCFHDGRILVPYNISCWTATL